MKELDRLVDSLAKNRYYVSDTLINNELVRALKDEALSRFEVGEFDQARVGRQLTKRLDQHIRRDKISWISSDTNEQTNALKEYFSFLNQLKDYLNPLFYLGIRNYEGHFAFYDTGAFYKKHVDQHRGRGLRRLSVILYLNDMNDGDGGEVVLYDFNHHENVLDTIRPKEGRLLIFISEDLPHEVLTAHMPRLSLTGWMRA
ncbi:oxidoreductase, 2OG-Fe(II) oxygenase family protein [Halobacteriovorax sp. BALOs_7]|nr:oxidoreductase, 2OG-Fe(II) oxygenase family protein [Halobacteriovorax sp. BALOs_7]